MKKTISIFIFLLSLLFIWGNNFTARAQEDIKGDLIIFNAGSLAVPFKEISAEFNKIYPKVNIKREAAGSRTCARKITDLNLPCDVMASADYTVIEKLLIPNFADWNISFTTNEMVIMYHEESKFADEINGENWPKILLKEGVQYGHSDPNCDPCGYRSQLVWQLAEKHYETPNLYKNLRENCPSKNVRPKEVDLLALIEIGELDYLFIYRSVAEQHKMPFVILPDEINLKTNQFADFYKQASIQITGEKPGTFITKTGEPMVYGVTIPKDAPNYRAAVAFVRFLVGPEGLELMRKNGQPPIVPPVVTGNKEKVDIAIIEVLK